MEPGEATAALSRVNTEAGEESRKTEAMHGADCHLRPPGAAIPDHAVLVDAHVLLESDRPSVGAHEPVRRRAVLRAAGSGAPRPMMKQPAAQSAAG